MSTVNPNPNSLDQQLDDARVALARARQRAALLNFPPELVERFALAIRFLNRVQEEVDDHRKLVNARALARRPRRSA